MNLIVSGIIFVIVSLAGFYSAYLYGRKTKKFRWSEYIAIIIGPIICILIMAYLIDIKILLLFIISCGSGLFLEYLLGLTYHKTLNKKLWEYKRFSIHEYSSFLSIPVWGIAGVIFWLLGKIIGL